MWLQFIAVFLLTDLILIVPGALALRAAHLPWTMCICLAAPLSVALFAVYGILLDMVHLHGAIPLVILAMGTPLAASLIFYRLKAHGASRNEREEEGEDADGRIIEYLMLAAYIIIGMGVMWFLFLRNLSEGPLSFMQFNDNATHLSLIKSMADSGSFNSLRTTSVPQNLPAEQLSTTGTSFYPAGFHIVAAVIASLLNASAACVENASVYTYTAVVLPLGVLALLRTVFPDKPGIAATGAAMPCISAAFPWSMVVVHQPYPNLAGFCALPAALALTCMVTEGIKLRHPDPIRPILLTASLIGMAFLHTNTLFTWALFTGPLVAFDLVPALISQTKLSRPRQIALSISIGIALVGAAVLLWITLLNASFLSSVTSYIWDIGMSDPGSAIISVLSQGYLPGIPQYALSALVIIGLIASPLLWRRPWLSISYLLFSAIYVVDLVSDDALKRLVAGFWYTDPERLTAMVALAAIPLAAVGLYSIVELFRRLPHISKRRGKPMHAPLPHGSISMSIALVATSILVFCPEFVICRKCGLDTAYDPRIGAAIHETSRGDDTPLSARESDFIEQVLDYIEPGEVVLNLPYDGSVFAYPTQDLNIYYKGVSLVGETETSELIRTGLSEVATNPEVQQAVRDTGARYYLALNLGDFHSTENGAMLDSDHLTFNGAEWGDLMSINDRTPGFTAVLSDGPLRLYRIDAAY